MKTPCIHAGRKSLFLTATVSFLAFLGACSFKRNNPLDIESEKYLSLTITAPMDSVTVTTDSLFIQWKRLGDLKSLDYRLDNGTWTDISSSTSLVLHYIDEGDHAVELRATNTAGTVDRETVSFTVDAVRGPAILMYPQRKVVNTNDTSCTVNIMLEEVEKIIGVNAFLVFDDSQIRFRKATSGWYFFRADTSGGDSLEISAACLDSIEGYSGTGALARITFEIRDLDNPAKISILAGKTKMTSSTGTTVTPRFLRKGYVVR